MKKMYAPEELKEKTIKDVNDAIESGEIETGGYLQPVIEDDKIVGYSLDMYNLDDEEYFTIEIEFYQQDISISNNNAVSFRFNSIYTTYFESVTYILGNNANSVYRYIYDIAGSQGIPGQVLTKENDGSTYGRLRWMTPKKLYQHRVSMSPQESGVEIGFISFNLFLNNNTTLTAATINSALDTSNTAAGGLVILNNETYLAVTIIQGSTYPILRLRNISTGVSMNYQITAIYSMGDNIIEII